ncbi:MAG: type VI secretion system protein ImpD [Cellvibrionaceae bacterium]
MSSLSSQSPTSPSASQIDFDALYGRKEYISNLREFIAETDHIKALLYWLSEFTDLSQVKTTTDIVGTIHRAISSIDHLINDQLNLIIHHTKLKKLEASWRGLWYLTSQAEGSKNIKIKVLDISWAEVVKDIGRALEFDQSQLFQKIYSEEYGSPGGEPYSVLIGDYEISHRVSQRHPQDDLATLNGIAQVAAAAFAPFIASASSEIFGLDDFSTLGLPVNLQKIFSQKEYIPWRALRDKADSRFIGLTMPRILMRLPYRSKPGSYKGLFFYEKSIKSTGEHYLWGNACYGFASILIREFANVGWFGHIRGVPRNQIGGGLLTNLPIDAFETDSKDIAYKPSTDVIITDHIEKEISSLGFIPLCQCYDTPFAAFYSNPSIQKPKTLASKDAQVNAKLSAMLQHVLCGSRVAHYIKVIIRDKIGSFVTADECENYLRNWLFKYTSNREDLEWEEQARYPLRRATVKVREHPAKPGHFLSVIHLVPHYQLEQMVSELELITELVQTG